MAPLPELEDKIAAAIDNHHQSKAEPPRPHMGCSMIGHPCDRRLWLAFRWAIVEQHPGRILRLFRRGQNEEATVVEDLRAIGVTVEKTGASQSRVSFGSHVSGSVDGVVENLPIAPRSRAVLEIKTHSAKSFSDLRKKGVKESHPTHWVQMQCYMYGLHLDRALYFAVCKDTDQIHTEWIHFEKPAAEAAIERAQRIALAERMPEPISADPSWYQCKLCPFHDFCHVSKMTKQTNCRTCAFSTAKKDSTWRCERHDADDIPVDFQRQGCESHVLHLDLVPWEVSPEHCTEHMATFVVDGTLLQNGDPDGNVYSSREIIANLAGCLSEYAREIRTNFGMEITG